MSGSRKRVSGTLSRGRRGLILTANDGELWIIDTNEDVTRHIDRRVIVEGALAGLDRLKVEWIGAAE